MIAYCEHCARPAEQVVIKNKRYKTIYAYCLRCNNKRLANKADIETIKAYARTAHIFR